MEGNYDQDIDDIDNFVKQQTQKEAKESSMNLGNLAAGIMPGEELKFDGDQYDYLPEQ